MKLFIAGLSTESNSFSPLPTGLTSFEEGGLHHGDATSGAKTFWSAPLHIWRELGEAKGAQVVESLCAHAQPAGPTVQSVYEGFRDEILADLRRAGPVDVILLGLHGAMIAQGCDDCEGDLISHCRRIAPDATIGALLDPHCHLTEAMLTDADLLVAYKEYPHVDAPERAADLFRLAIDAAEGRTRPVMRDFDCRMIITLPTPTGPMRDFVDDMLSREGAGGVLSLSLCHGFPWGDHPRVGCRALAICDGDADHAAQEAEALGRRLYALREVLHEPMPDIETALDLAEAEPWDAQTGRPVVLADVSDNAGGGAPSDSTFLLRAMLDRGMTGVATGIYWDPIAVRICAEAGVGARLPLRLGGKCGPMSGDPLDLEVTVKGVADGLTQLFGTLPAPLGRLVWLEAQGVDILVNDLRGQTFHPEAFEKMGLDLARRRYVCVKSSNHFQAGFRPIASRIIHVATPGAITPHFAQIPFTRRARDYFPILQDPLA